MPPKAYSYIRMSIPEQIRGDSLRRQLQKTRDYAAKRGLVLDESNQMQDLGKSAFAGSNVTDGVLGEFLRRVSDGQIEPGSFLLVESLDRLSRKKIMTALAQLQEILEKKIVVVTLVDEKEFHDLDDPQQLMLSIMVMHRAYEESLTKSKRIGAAWENKRRKAVETGTPLTKICPAWLEKSNDGFRVIPERRDIVIQIFEDCVSGIGAFSTARRLNEAGVPTFQSETSSAKISSHRSKVWQPSYIKKILKNRAVLGEYRPHLLDRGEHGKKCRKPTGEVIVNYFPPIIDEALFDKASVAIDQRRVIGGGRTGEQFANLFRGLLFCAACDGRMVVISKGPKPKGGRYLVCERGQRGSGCTKKAWRYESFEKAFLLHMKSRRDLLATPERSSKSAFLASQLEGVDAKLQIKKRQAELMDLWIDPSSVDGTTIERRRQLEREIIEQKKESRLLSTELRRQEAIDEESRSSIDLISTLQSRDGDVYQRRAFAAKKIGLQYDRIEIDLCGLENMLIGPKAEFLDAKIGEEDLEEFLEGYHWLRDAPSFAAYPNVMPPYLIQPHPKYPKFWRFRCPLRPKNYKSLEPGAWRYVLRDRNTGREIPYEPHFEYSCWGEDEIPVDRDKASKKAPL